MLWFNKMLHVLIPLVNGEVNFLNNSKFDGQVEIIDTRNLIISLPIKETFNYPIRYIIDTRNLVISLSIKETFSYPFRYIE